MNLINQHILDHFPNFRNEKDAFFQDIVELFQSEVKDKYWILLRYIHLLLDEVFSEEISETKTLILHFAYDFDDDSLLIIAQYLLIRFFKASCTTATSSSQSNEKIELLKTNLRSKLQKLSACPDDASGKNGGNRIYKNWIKHKNDIKKLIDFFDKLDNDIEISANAIFNCQVRLAKSLNDFLVTRPYASEIENDNCPTFTLLNTKLTLNEIDEIDNSIIDNLETVILFDCERKKLMQYFSLQDIKDYDVNLKKYLILSFGNKNNSAQSLKDKLALIQSRFKISNNVSYPIIQSEIDNSLGLKAKKQIPVSFIGIDSSDLWDAFILETSIQDLYELRSIKMMNLYSLCYNEEIKDFILQDIFSEKDTSELISDETKQRLLDQRDEDLSTLRESLGNVLDLIISTETKQTLSEKIKSDTVLVVDDFVLSSKKLKRLISSTLLLSERNKLFSWPAFMTIENESILILSYQDQGKYPYYFYPNVIETTVSKDITIEAIYHKSLFSSRLQWAKYNIAKNLYELTDHPIRQKYFNWKRLKGSIDSLRPQKGDDTNWDLEQQYSGNTNRETIKLKLKNERERTYNSSELFIYSTDKLNFKVERIGDIIEASDEDAKYFVHHLDEIQENINLYEKMIDTSQQEAELNIIRQHFQLNDTETGRLWKVLLKQKASYTNAEDLYDELKTHLENKGLKIVSLHHFKNNWLDNESVSIAPLNKKVFIELCSFLNLPKTYFILIQRLRNSSKQSSSQSTRQMNRLLQDLFNDGCFDDGADIGINITTNLESYKRKHPLDELGIDEKYLRKNLIALVELIKTEVTLKELEKFKKVE
jgi:hypothetical protein